MTQQGADGGRTMPENGYRIRVMHRGEVDLAAEWAAREGWNPGLHDARCYYAVDAQGFLIGLLNDEPIATISVVRYDDSFGFLGFYIVRPEYRGQGYGIQIWNAGLRYLAGVTIGLDGVVAQQENYRKSGFELAGRNIRYEGAGGGDSPRPGGIIELSALPFQVVEAYDRPFLPAARSQFLRAWICQPDSHALGVLQDGELAGYGVIRRCRTGYKIGPLYADRPELADELFRGLKCRAGAADRIFLDVPEANSLAVELAGRHGMQVSFETARMYRGPAPALPLDRMYGVTSFEIG